MANVNVSQMMPYTDYGAELEDLKRRQAYAELLRAQSMKPLQGAGMTGRTLAPISHAQGLAQMLQAANAGLESQNVSQERKALSARAEADRMNTLRKMAAQLRGQPQVGAPASVENIIDEQAMGGEGAPAQIMAPQTPNYQPAIPPDRMGAMMTALGSQDPMLRQMGMEGFAKQLNPKLNTHVTDSRSVTTDDQGNVVSRTDFPPTTNQSIRNSLSAAQFAQKQHEYNNLSAAERMRFEIEGRRLGMEGIDVWFRTGFGLQPPLNIPQNGPMPQAPNMTGQPPQGAPQAPQQQVPQQQVPQHQFHYVDPNTGYSYSGSTATEAGAKQVMEQLVGKFNGGPQLPPSPQPGLQAPQVPPSPLNVPPRDRVKLEMERPQAEAHQRAVASMTSNALREINKLGGNYSGTYGITGGVMGRLPNVRDVTINAQAALDTLKSILGVNALNSMREMSKTGGAVGQVTEKEWPILQAQMGALQQVQSQDEFLKGLEDVRQTLERLNASATKIYVDTYGNPDRVTEYPSARTPTGEKRDEMGRRKYNPRTGRIE